MAFSGSLIKTTLSSKGVITKGADADAAVALAHGLGGTPDFCILTATAGTEAAWRVASMDATNINLEASVAVGSAASSVSVVAGVLHSIIQ